MIYARRKRLYRAYRVTAQYTHMGIVTGYFGNSYDNEREYNFPNSSRSRPEQFERTALLTKATNYVVRGVVHDRNKLK